MGPKRARGRAGPWTLLISGGCCALSSFNAWAEEPAASNMAFYSSASSSFSVADLAKAAKAAESDAAPARRHGYTEVTALVLPAWDRPSSVDAAQRSPAAYALGHFGNLGGRTDMPPTRVEFSHWAHARGGTGVALGVVQPGSNGAAAWNGPAEVRDPSSHGASLELGLRWRGRVADQMRLDVGAWRRMTNNTPDAYTLTQTNDDALYAARVEVQFPSAKYGGLAPELGAVGMQMSGGGKVVLRAKRGGPMVYYRAKF